MPPTHTEEEHTDTALTTGGALRKDIDNEEDSSASLTGWFGQTLFAGFAGATVSLAGNLRNTFLGSTSVSALISRSASGGAAGLLLGGTLLAIHQLLKGNRDPNLGLLLISLGGLGAVAEALGLDLTMEQTMEGTVVASAGLLHALS